MQSPLLPRSRTQTPTTLLRLKTVLPDHTKAKDDTQPLSRSRRGERPGFAFFFLGTPRFEASHQEAVLSKQYPGYSPLHRTKSRFESVAAQKRILQNMSLAQFTPRRKMKRLRTLAHTRDERIRQAQTLKQEQWMREKLVRTERLEVKNGRMELRLRGREIAAVAQSWVLLSVFLGLGLWTSARFQVKLVKTN